MVDRTLGVLRSENEPIDLPQALMGQSTFSFPVKHLVVSGAWVPNLLAGDRTIAPSFVECAVQLESEGASALIANCGFASLYQAEVAAAVSIPVALSSLSLVPFVATTVPRGAKVGILSYDSAAIKEEHYVAAGWSSTDIPVAVTGIKGTESYDLLARPVIKIDPRQLIRDVLTAANNLIDANPDIAALVLECASFPLAAQALRDATGLPVADYVGLANMLVEMSPGPNR